LVLADGFKGAYLLQEEVQLANYASGPIVNLPASPLQLSQERSCAESTTYRGLLRIVWT